MYNYTNYFLIEKEAQDSGVLERCPRCGKNTMNSIGVRNAVSRYHNLLICPACGEDEVLRDLDGKRLPPYQWKTVQEELAGRTFYDLLCKTWELECELIIDNSDMPATFYWCADYPITAYGVEYYAEIMRAPYERLANSNIEIYCDNYELGTHFVLAIAGHIAASEYDKLFRGSELEAGSVSCTDAPVLAGECLDFQIFLHADVIQLDGMSEAVARLHAVYNPETDSLDCHYYAVHADGSNGDKVVFYHTPHEADLLRKIMMEFCHNNGYASPAELRDSLKDLDD